MTGYDKGQAHLRRLYRAPDSVNEMIATCDKTYVPYLNYTCSTHLVHVEPEDYASRPRVSLPFPAIDLAWCPFKKGESDAAFVTASRDQPLQLWDVEDASLRASYVAANDSDYHVHAHTVCWCNSAGHSHWIVGGYGGFEDATQVRVFDVLAEGSQPLWTYGAQRSHGRVSALQDCAWAGTTSLLAVGYSNMPAVHLVDCRNRCPVAELHGLHHGVRTLRAVAANPLHVYAGGSQGDSRIACWDVRKPRVPLFTLSRHVSTNQVFDFDMLPARSTEPHERRLVTSSSSGGVVVYSWPAGETPKEGDTGVVFGAAVGPTSGLTTVDAETVVVTTGCRDYRYNPQNLHKTAGAASQATRLVAGKAEDSEEDRAEVMLRCKRARSPMTDTSDEEEGAAAAGTNASADAEATNVAVIVLK